MRLEKASQKAIKFACLNFHYAKSVPAICTGYSVFNDKKEFCGVILFGLGASPNINKQFNLNKGEVIELVRVALNGKQQSTSKAVSISLILTKKQIPLCKLIISFADKDHNHNGTIYQASNWYFIDECNVGDKTGYLINGIKRHQRSMMSLGKFRNNTLLNAKSIDSNATNFYTKGKYKYIYPLHKSLIPLCKQLSKPYPKKQTSAGSVTVAQQASSLQEGFNSTPALNKI